MSGCGHGDLGAANDSLISPRGETGAEEVDCELGGGKGSRGWAEEGEAVAEGQGQAHSPPPGAQWHLNDSGNKTLGLKFLTV